MLQMSGKCYYFFFTSKSRVDCKRDFYLQESVSKTLFRLLEMDLSIQISKSIKFKISCGAETNIKSRFCSVSKLKLLMICFFSWYILRSVRNSYISCACFEASLQFTDAVCWMNLRSDNHFLSGYKRRIWALWLLCLRLWCSIC